MDFISFFIPQIKKKNGFTLSSFEKLFFQMKRGPKQEQKTIFDNLKKKLHQSLYTVAYSLPKFRQLSKFKLGRDISTIVDI